jgi:hypothetical protein
MKIVPMVLVGGTQGIELNDEQAGNLTPVVAHLFTDVFFQLL